MLGVAPYFESLIVFVRGHILVFHYPYDHLFTAESQRAQSEISFSFAAETRLRMKLRRAKRRQMKTNIAKPGGNQ
jgi:hypothetical protein